MWEVQLPLWRDRVARPWDYRGRKRGPAGHSLPTASTKVPNIWKRLLETPDHPCYKLNTTKWSQSVLHGTEKLPSQALLEFLTVFDFLWLLDSLLYNNRYATHLTSTPAAAESLQSCPTLCDPIDGSPPDCTVPGILQATNWSGLPFPLLNSCKKS